MKKNTKKTFKPSYKVDIDKIETLNDIDLAFGLSKQKAGLAISDKELAAICTDVCDHFCPKTTVVICNCKQEKKLPWYKRFWNWLTRKNK